MLCPHCHADNADDARFCGACGKATLATEPVSNPNLGEGPALIGRVIAGRYRILSKLGEGGMGAVFRAEQISLKRTVAIKLLRPDVSGSPMLLRRFNAEAEAVAKLRHPNTVNIYDFGQDTDATLFIAMELIEGQSLRTVIHHDAPLSIRRTLAIASQVAASLADAHAKTIIHRDLKPDNVMLTDRGRSKDNVTVLDFGIAKLRDDPRGTQHQLTQAGDMLGTPQYMAPEQIRGEQIDGRTDVYALGGMIYEMITGRMPYEAPTVMALLSKHLLEQAPPPSQRRPDLGIPPAVDDLVMSAMAKDPAARPATMEDLGERIAAVLATLPPESTVQRSAVVGVPPGLGSALPAETPAAFSAAGFMPSGPPPPGAAHQSSGFVPPPGAAHQSSGFVPPHSAPYAAPYPGGQPAGMPPHPSPYVHAGAPPRGRSKLIWIIVAALLCGAGGVGIYLATRDEPAPTSADKRDEPDDDDDKDQDDYRAADRRENERQEAERQEAEKHQPDKWDRTPDTADADDHDSDDGADDDGSSSGSGGSKGSGASKGSNRTPAVAGKTVDVGQGIKVIAPPGMAVQRQAQGVVMFGDPTKYAVLTIPLTGSSNDPDVIARAYAKETTLKLVQTETAEIAGAQRKVYAFAGSINGMAMVHIGVPLIGRGYRLAVILHMLATVAKDDAGARGVLNDFLTRRIILPSRSP